MTNKLNDLMVFKVEKEVYSINLEEETINVFAELENSRYPLI